ncbi:hypothetical protein AMTR_s00025p00229930 [Amborella trichopoda]|uniref:RING-type domain-containing protein n=1 Tax=Amborella trichopoda TaxID=13333 RepID=W1PWR5_AMBTC|nr:hypothetical protein AMTR_s00025p00229930 [Amborella trichopoda]
MSFSVEYSGFVVLQLLYRVYFFLAAIRGLLAWTLRFCGLRGLPESYYQWPESWPENEDSGQNSDSQITAEMIRRGLPVSRYENHCEHENTCAVCLNEMRSEEIIRELIMCSHIFHKECLDRWVDSDRKTCPLCRTPLIVAGMSAPEYFAGHNWAVEKLIYLFADDLILEQS